MTNVERIRDWYRSGGRLSFPISFRVAVLTWRKLWCMVEVVRGIEWVEVKAWTWLIDRVIELKMPRRIDLKIGQYEVEAWWQEDSRFYESALVVSFGDREVSGEIQIGIKRWDWRLYDWSKYIVYKEFSKAQRASLMFEHLRLELEERLNGLLERELFR